MPKRKKDDIEKDKRIREMGKAMRKDIDSVPYPGRDEIPEQRKGKHRK